MLPCFYPLTYLCVRKLLIHIPTEEGLQAFKKKVHHYHPAATGVTSISISYCWYPLNWVLQMAAPLPQLEVPEPLLVVQQ
jgi:hypothetical protein